MLTQPIRRVLTLSTVSPTALAKLQAHRNGCSFIVGKSLENPDTVILRSQPFNVDEHPSVKLVVRAGTEANKVTGSGVEEGRVCVEMTLGANSQSVAEWVIGAIIIMGRMFPAAHDFVRKMDYKKPPEEFDQTFESGKSAFLGRELSGQVLGVIGVGQVGSRVIQTALLLGMRVIAYERDRLSPLYKWLPAAVTKADSIEYVLENASTITVHVPGENNKHLIGPSQIAHMRMGANLINAARRDICDSATILAALKEGKLGGYFSDFPDQALPIDHPKIVCLPHLGGNTIEAQERCGDVAADQIIDFWTNGNVWSSKNLPSVVVARASSAVMRLGIPHHNREGVLAQVQKIIAGKHVNISTNENKTNAKFGYYVVDLDQELPEAQIQQIRGLQEVIDVWVYRF